MVSLRTSVSGQFSQPVFGQPRLLTQFSVLRSNCSGSLLLDLYKYARIKPANLQVEIHP